MAVDRWQRLQRQFRDIADLDSDQRQSRLDRLHREEPELAREVQSLLAADSGPHDRIARVISSGAGLLLQDEELSFGESDEPLDRYCDDRRLTIAARLRLFRSVCDVVDQDRCRVRDASEIRVFSDGRPQLELQASDTGNGARDAPRRADREGAAAVVHALGRVLYELLTGSAPVTASSNAAPAPASRDAARKEWMAPSDLPWTGSRSDRGDWTARGAARDRRLGPRRLRRALRGELDAVVLRALSVNEDRGYRSPRQLGDDIERYLQTQPVSACERTTGYVARTFLRRHRRLIWTVAAALTLAISVVVWLARGP